MYVEDQTTGCSVSDTFGPGGNNSQFECIVETVRDHYLNDLSPTQITFSSCEAFTSNSGGIYIIMGHNPGHWTPFQMLYAGTACAIPSTSTGANGSFTVTFHYRCDDGKKGSHP